MTTAAQAIWGRRQILSGCQRCLPRLGSPGPRSNVALSARVGCVSGDSCDAEVTLACPPVRSRSLQDFWTGSPRSNTPGGPCLLPTPPGYLDTKPSDTTPSSPAAIARDTSGVLARSPIKAGACTIVRIAIHAPSKGAWPPHLPAPAVRSAPVRVPGQDQAPTRAPIAAMPL